MMRLRTGLTVLLLAALTMAPTSGQGTRKSTTHMVEIKGFEFLPREITVQAGDTIVWTNRDIVPHTATAKGGFDSGEIGAGKSWSYKAVRKGRFPYICTYRPTMRGTVIIQ